MASSLSRRLITKLPQNPSLNPWLSASKTIYYPRSPSDGNPFRFFNASSFFSTSRFPAQIPTATQFNFLRSFPIRASENPPFHKPEPSNKAIPVVKPRSSTPTFFKPYWVSSQTSFLPLPAALNPDSTRHFSKSRSRSPQNHNLRNPQNPTQNPKVEDIKPHPRELEKTLEEFEDFASTDASEVKRVLESLRKNTRDLSMSLGLLGVAHFGPWVYKATHMGEVFSLSGWAAFAFPGSLAFLAWRVLKPMDLFERQADEGKMSPLSRTIFVSGEMDKLFLRFRIVALLCIVAACSEPLLNHVLAALK